MDETTPLELNTRGDVQNDPGVAYRLALGVHETRHEHLKPERQGRGGFHTGYIHGRQLSIFNSANKKETVHDNSTENIYQLYNSLYSLQNFEFHINQIFTILNHKGSIIGYSMSKTTEVGLTRKWPENISASGHVFIRLKCRDMNIAEMRLNVNWCRSQDHDKSFKHNTH